MSRKPAHERHLDIVKEAVATALRWHELSTAAAIEFAAQAVLSQAAIKRSRETLARLDQKHSR